MPVRVPAPCGLRVEKRRSPFPGRMSYKATKRGSVCPLLAEVSFECLMQFTRAIFVLRCFVFVFCLLVDLVSASD